MKLLKEFKAFILKGNVVDLAVAVIIGGAFGKIVSSIVNDIFMPLIGLIIGGISFDNLFWAVNGKHYETAAAAADAGVGVVNVGAFIKNTVDFVIIAAIVFLVIKSMSLFKRKKEAAPPPRLCPYCKKEIDKEASRCPFCTSELDKTGVKVG
jgi:large conductance mechanosensitive channel